MKFLRILLFPFSILYGLLVLLRNKLYDWGIFSSTEFDIPIISVGNLSVGGTGKTPHIEYLIRLLGSEFSVATLSRGYGRKTKGFVLADTQSGVTDIGDEPLQFKTKFNDVLVAVDENRVRGVIKTIALLPSVKTILLDDAFQHRAIKPGLSVVLTDFSKLYLNDRMMPTGSLREFGSGIKRADILIVTKCPEVFLPIDRKRLITEIAPLPNQNIYFSKIKYGKFILVGNKALNILSKEEYFKQNYSIVLLTGIANAQPLENYLKENVKNVVPVKFPDHHKFTINDLLSVKKIFDNIASTNKVLLTTEKDTMRLKEPAFSAILNTLPFFYIPIEIEFTDGDEIKFNEQILNYVRTN